MADAVGRRPYRALPRPGDVKLSLVATDHDGWMLLDGRQTLSRAAFPRLFAELGTRYGTGDGSTTFGIPKAGDGFLMAAGAFHALGSTGGAESHTLTVDELPAHDHGYSKLGKASTNPKLSTAGLLPVPLVSDLVPADSTTAKAGGGKPFPILPPFLALNAFVYAGM